MAITVACSLGNLELNAFLPLVADRLLDSLDLLSRGCGIFRTLCVEGLAVNEGRCREQVENATASVTALVEELGYARATELARAVRQTKRPLRELVVERGLMTAEAFDAAISPERVTRLGSRSGPAGSETP
jgi:aspartate ammonia-lyase